VPDRNATKSLLFTCCLILVQSLLSCRHLCRGP
jgi:hypothetical protein